MVVCPYCSSNTPHMDGCPKQATAISRAVREALEAMDEARTAKYRDLAATAASTKQVRLASDQSQQIVARNENRGVVIVANDDDAQVFLATDRNLLNDTTKQFPLKGHSAMVFTSPGELYGLGSTAAAQNVFVMELPPGRQSAEFAQILGSMLGSSGAPQVVRIEDGTTASLATVAAPGDAAAGYNGVGVNARLMGYNGANYDRLRSGITSDGQALTGFLGAMPWLYNNGTLDRARSASAANLAATSGLGAVLTTYPGQWTVVSTPAANVQATATKAGVAGTRHVCTGISLGLKSGVAPAAVRVAAMLRDGASGVGAELWHGDLAIQAVAGAGDHIHITGLNIVGTAGNAMTLEFGAAGGANTFETVTLSGYDAT